MNLPSRIQLHLPLVNTVNTNKQRVVGDFRLQINTNCRMVYVGLTSNKPFMFIIMKEYEFLGISGTDLSYLRLLKLLTILESTSLLAFVFSAGMQMVNSDWQNLRRFHFPWKSGCIVCLSGLKGRISAGDYREETIGEANGDFVS